MLKDHPESMSACSSSSNTERLIDSVQQVGNVRDHLNEMASRLGIEIPDRPRQERPRDPGPQNMSLSFVLKQAPSELSEITEDCHYIIDYILSDLN